MSLSKVKILYLSETSIAMKSILYKGSVIMPDLYIIECILHKFPFIFGTILLACVSNSVEQNQKGTPRNLKPRTIKNYLNKKLTS